MTEVKYDGVGFNADSAASKSKEQFVKEHLHVMGEEKLKEVYALCMKAVKKSKS